MKLYNAAAFRHARGTEADSEGVAEALQVCRGDRRIAPALVGRTSIDSSRRSSVIGINGMSASRVAMGGTGTDAMLVEQRFTLERFAEAAKALDDRGVALRVFLLISPPFIPSHEQDAWLLHSIDAAFSCGASVVSLVPTRPGNGAIERLATAGWFRAPHLEDIERSCVGPGHGGSWTSFVDAWDLERFAQCSHCTGARRDRLQDMNLEQIVLPQCPCPAGDHGPLQ